jgi:serine/threonine protein kinase
VAMHQASQGQALVQRAEARLGTVLQEKWRLYAATHRNTKRVAVKVLHADLSRDSGIVARFLREGYAANIVEHEGAVSVLDDDVAADGSAFLVMELLEGETLEQRWLRKDKQLELREVLTFADKLLDVLTAAHEKSIVHRDIKPENLFLTRSGLLKVLDFGIARVFEGHAQKTATVDGQIMGTPAFMAPEQALAKWDEVDGRTDLWAVGATMFTLLTGQHVHEASTGNEQLVFSATRPARSIASAKPDLPRSVVATIDRALAFQREQRWPDARRMQEAVRGALEALSTAIARKSGAPPPPISMPRISIPSADEVSGIAPGGVIEPPRSRTIQASWTAERDARAAEVARARPVVQAISQKLAADKKRVDEAQARLEAARAERAQMQELFNRQVGTRTAAVEEARKEVRRHLCGLAKQASDDKTTFGDAFAGSREETARLTRVAEERRHDVAVHEAALRAFDPSALRTGLVLASIAAFLLLLALVTPIWMRATMTSAPPDLRHDLGEPAPK